MIAYVDTSALLKLIIEEDGSERTELVWDAADVVGAVPLLVVEARAALASATRSKRLTAAQHRSAKRALSELVGDLTLVELTDPLLASASELAEVEALRGYDAVHLAGALTLGADLLLSADGDLCAAAGRRGLHVANPLEG